MPMTIPWDEHALKFLISPPAPLPSLRDIALNTHASMDMMALSKLGRSFLRCCVTTRMFNPPITVDFEEKIDATVEDARLARIARESGLLERLKVHEVATETVDVAHILCAYVGATLRCGWKRSRVNGIEDSVNDICSKILDEDENPVVIQNDSHKKMLLIDGMEKMSTPAPFKSEPPPSFVSSTSASGFRVNGEAERNSNESISSALPTILPAQSRKSPAGPTAPDATHPPAIDDASTIRLLSSRPRCLFESRVRATANTAWAGDVSPGQGLYQQPQPQYPQAQAQYLQTQYTSPPPQSVPVQPQSNVIPPGWGGSQPQQNPPGYNSMPAQSAVPAPMPMMPPLPTQQTQGFISLFNELAMKHRMTTSWQTQKTGQQHIPEWTMWLLVDGTPRGHGTASTKQAAKEVAAKAALQAMGWLSI
ncbi:double-stranded RNA-binding motif protein [Ceratobasidium sp. AG-Ba]|nr:double-stranded RNA-binding motif protein [Ceratobasidium sp. AG-Ba]